MGVASVALVHAAVRRWGSGPAAGLLAGAARTRHDSRRGDDVPVRQSGRPAGPAARGRGVLREVRATEKGNSWRLAGAGVALGFSFALTKMMQALLVLPALGLVFLVAAPIGLPCSGYWE